MLFFIRFCQRGHLRKGGHGGSGEIGNFVLSAPTCEGAPYHCEIRWWVLQIEVLENAVYYNGGISQKTLHRFASQGQELHCLYCNKQPLKQNQ